MVEVVKPYVPVREPLLKPMDGWDEVVVVVVVELAVIGEFFLLLLLLLLLCPVQGSVV